MLLLMLYSKSLNETGLMFRWGKLAHILKVELAHLVINGISGYADGTEANQS